ncbi:MAG: adenylosuccinate synthetase, partial [Deltaproteobacteria bacterium]
KAYATRVGSGPFPTEATEADGEELRKRGGEYGAVTGRPRRCGWFDVVAARYAAGVNGLEALVITKLDILDPLAEIPVAIGYELDGAPLSSFPAQTELLERVKVRYQTAPGWQEPTFGIKDVGKLPPRARDYLKLLSDQVGVPIIMVSTGPERDQMFWWDRSKATELLAGA